jgi:hypothetical protein
MSRIWTAASSVTRGSPRTVLAGAVTALALAGCVGRLPVVTAPVSSLGSAAPASPAGTASGGPAAASEPAPAGSRLPAGFPVMPGARAEGLPGDGTVIARWSTTAVGSAAYDYYLTALPQHGYAIVGLYPSERAALIRFDGPGGSVWQLLAEQVGNGTLVTLQTDRP